MDDEARKKRRAELIAERRASRRRRARARDTGVTDLSRERIRYGMCINRLQNFVAGRIEMSPHQVTAALGLLRKGVPDLQAIEHAGMIEHEVAHTISDKPMTNVEWAQQYGDAGDTRAH